MRHILFSLIIASSLLPAVANGCPDLSPYYQPLAGRWETLRDQLYALQSECLTSAEYFALRGAAELNSGLNAAALESLERSLLLEPDYAAAKVDYAQVLYLEGQIFVALELNEELLQREDVPAGLESLLLARQQSWRGQTRQHSKQLDLLVGYDNNLNGAPDSQQLTLTLSGEPILLDLNDEFRPVEEPYLNLRLATRYRQLQPDYQHNWLSQLRGRLSDDSASNLLQLDNRYAYVRPGNTHSWQLALGVNTLLFGGSPLFTASESRFSGQRAGPSACQPGYDLALQHQIFHDQSQLNALEGRAAVGVNCGSSEANQLGVEFGLLYNEALRTARPGADRHGWQVSVNWQRNLGGGFIRAQLQHTNTMDHLGFSPLLNNGAVREVDRSHLHLQYQVALPGPDENTLFTVNFFQQVQRSNLELFRSTDSSLELGLSLRF